MIIDSNEDTSLPELKSYTEVTVVTGTKNTDDPFQRLKNQATEIKMNFLKLFSAGNKQFKDISKRVRLMAVAILIPIAFGIVKIRLAQDVTLPQFWAIVAVVLSTLSIPAILWALKFQIRKEAYFSVIPIFPVFVFLFVFFFAVIFPDPTTRVYLTTLFIGTMFVFSVALYIIGLSLNVLNVNLFYLIPLSKIAESIIYLLTPVFGFFLSFGFLLSLWFFVNESSILGIISTITASLVINYIIYYSYLSYFTPLARKSNETALMLAILVVIITVLAGLLTKYIWIAAIIISLYQYIVNGVMIHRVQNSLKFSTIIEYSLIGIIILVLLVWA